jgi:diguanylate cyclase (GGDEF)-like protein
MQSNYNWLLVLFSVLVACLASYTTLDLATRVSSTQSPERRPYWLIGGAAALGLGIWSMHFIGMLAFSLPIEIGYDLVITLGSLVIAVAVALFALSIIMRNELSPKRLVMGGVLMGLGIAGMHYTGMAAMRMEPPPSYNPWLVAGSVLIAIAASITALWITFVLRGNQRYLLAKRLTAATIMGGAIAGMHYTGMAAASFPLGSRCGAASGIDPRWLAVAVTAFTLIILTTTLVLSRLDTYFQSQTRSLALSLSNANRQLVRLATRDQLTNLPNRTTLGERMQRAMRASRDTGHPFAVLFMDLDGFKTINDSLGHSIGDALLKAFAQRLRNSVRRHDTVSRIGGDEFVLLLEGLTDSRDAANICAGILTDLQQDLMVEGTSLRITASIGIAIFPTDGESIEDLLKNADGAMYSAKQSGRNTFRFFEPHMAETAMRALHLQRGLQDAIVHGHLLLHFQPKFIGNGDGSDRTIAGAEALIRWNHPELGMIQPLDFIPIAERSGQIVEIGYWVVRETCRHLKQWAAEGLPPIKVALNLSPQQLWQTDLVENIDAIVREAQVPPELLMFEITESVAMQDAERTTGTIRQFHARGFEIAIDDFGTGYSSLAYLQQFRVKQLKIDRFFTDGLDKHGDEAYAIVSAIIALAHSLKMDVVAEGVETPSQLAKLNALLCDQVQGFFLSKPLPGAEFTHFMRNALSAPASTSPETA